MNFFQPTIAPPNFVRIASNHHTHLSTHKYTTTRVRNHTYIAKYHTFTLLYIRLNYIHTSGYECVRFTMLTYFLSHTREDTRYNARRKPARQAFYADLFDMVQRMFRSPFAAEMLRYGPRFQTQLDDAVEDRELNDVYDGSILEDLYHKSKSPNRHITLYASLTCDGTEVAKNKSYTPCVLKWCGFPPQVPRGPHDAIHQTYACVLTADTHRRRCGASWGP